MNRGVIVCGAVLAVLSAPSCTNLRGARKMTADAGTMDASIGARDASSKSDASAKKDSGAVRRMDGAVNRFDGTQPDAAQRKDAGARSGRDSAVEAGVDACSGSACPATDPCASNPCGEYASCAKQAAAPGYNCSCDSGYTLSGKNCIDIDECAEATQTCHPSATCKNTDGAYDCTCPLGYAGGTPDGFACTPRVAVGYDHTCALFSNGHVSCWGQNDQGQLGDGTMTNSTSPVAVSGITNAMGIEAGGGCSCAVLKTGTTTCWGVTAFKSTHVALLPERVAGLDDAVMVATDCRHSCAVRRNGHVACWGNGEGGSLGNGDTTSTIVTNAVDVPTVENALHVSVGASNGAKSCATRRSGEVQCWGAGLLGNGSSQGSSTPVTVSTLTNAISTAQAYAHSCALLSTGSVACWGQRGLDGHTATGDAGIEYDLEPVNIVNGCKAMALTLYDSCVLRADGTIGCWGVDAGPFLTTLSGISNAVAIAADTGVYCAILADGTIYCFSQRLVVETAPNIRLW